MMESDVTQADLILWVGISFEQSASTTYFRRVRGMLRSAQRAAACRHALINPSEDALWNLTSACSNLGEPWPSSWSGVLTRQTARSVHCLPQEGCCQRC